MKYPIILAHGIMLKDILHFKAFGKIEKILREAGYTVYTSDHDGMGTIANNAEQMKSFILNVLAREGVEKVNIVAHSKGGLDALYMIDRLLMSEYVASVTFLCTPHKGSVMASKLYDLPKIIRNPLAWWLDLVYRVAGDKRPNSLEVCRSLQLTPTSVLECFDIHDGIYMQSYSSELLKSKDDFVMGIPLLISKRFEGKPSDGMVSVESSQYGTYRGNCTPTSISHSQIVDFLATKGKKEQVYGFYRMLAKELEEYGF